MIQLRWRDAPDQREERIFLGLPERGLQEDVPRQPRETREAYRG